MKYFFSICVFSGLILSCSQQEEYDSRYFELECYGDHVHVLFDLIQTTSNEYVMVGETTAEGSEDILFVRSDQYGNVLQSFVIKADSIDVSTNIIQTKDEGFLLSGQSNSFGSDRYDIPIIKLSKDGELEWSKLLGGYNFDYGTDLIQDRNGDYVITGYSYSYGVGEDDIYIMKMNQSGDTLWTQLFGGPKNEHSYAVAQCPDDGYVITGFTMNFSNGFYDTYVIKTNVNGDTLWTRTFGGDTHDRGFDIVVKKNGNIVIAGGSERMPNNMDFMLLELSSDGDLISINTYDSGENEMATSLDIAEDGGFVLCGWTKALDETSDQLIVRTDSLGNILWYKCAGKDREDIGHRAIVTDKGDLTVISKILIEEGKPYRGSLLNQPLNGEFQMCNAKEINLTQYHPEIHENKTTTQITRGMVIKSHSFELLDTKTMTQLSCNKKPD